MTDDGRHERRSPAEREAIAGEYESLEQLLPEGHQARRVLRNLDAVCSAALRHEREYTNKDGRPGTVPQPMWGTVVRAQEAAARILGLARHAELQAQERARRQQDWRVIAAEHGWAPPEEPPLDELMTWREDEK